MDTKMLTAIFAVALIAIGGIGVSAAMPEDLVDFGVSPSEKALEYADKINSANAALDKAVEAGQITAYQKIGAMDGIYHAYVEKLAKYVRTYNYISMTELTTDGPDYGSMVIENVAFTVGNSSFSLGAGTFSWYGDTITVETAYVTVTATALAFSEDEQTATLTDVVYNGIPVDGVYDLTW